jgi:osmotically-inducible protein OsmY
MNPFQRTDWPPSAPDNYTDGGRVQFRRVSRDPGFRGPKGYRRTDARIREELCEGLTQRQDLDVSDVSIDVLGGRVTLIGTVPYRHMKYAIEDFAADVAAVTDVDNQIRVKANTER